MKPSPVPVVILSLLGALALTGCSGIVSVPDTILPGAQVYPGAIHGSVFGGHSPIVGAEVYVLQAGTGTGATAYASASTNELNSTAAYGTDPTHSYYVLTDSSGAFTIGSTTSSDYTCTGPTGGATQGEPVYLAAVGGTTQVGAYLIDITGSTVTRSGSTYYITFTTTTDTKPTGSVYFNSGAFTATGYTSLNNTTYAVSTSIPATTTSFTIQAGSSTTPNGATGYALALAGGAVNNSITTMAVLGNCPGDTGEFANTLSYVYLDEVSTVATAYALNGFGTGPFNIGAPSSNLTGIQNAASTSGQLYNIQTGGGAAGIGALQQTSKSTIPNNASSGTPSYKTVNTLGNILANCVDDTASGSCASLFDNATSNGTANSGTIPTDTATAVFNIAQHPGSNVTAIYKLQGTETSPPYAGLTTQPNDFTVSIAYTGGELGATDGKSPHSVAVDASGNIYTVSYTSSLLNIFNPLGVPQSSTGYKNNGLDNPVSVAVDSTSSNVWIANYGSSTVSEFSIAGAPVSTYSDGETNATQQRDAEIDGNNGNIWVSVDKYSTNNPSALVELAYYNFGIFGSGYNASSITTGVSAPYGVAIDESDNVWVADENEDYGSVCILGTGFGAAYACTEGPSGTTVVNPIGVAIDANNHAWVANSNGTVSDLVSTTTTKSGKTTTTITGTAYPANSKITGVLDGIAMDGLSNVWVTSTANNYIYELSNAGALLSNAGTATLPTYGYTATSPDGIAIDGSGNVWYTSTASGTLYEIVGAASPVVTPLSLAVANSTLGTEP